MKKIVFTVLGIVVAIGSLIAQPGNRDLDPKERVKLQVDRLDKVLDLTNDQYSKIYNLHLNAINDRQQAIGNKEEKRAAMQASMKEILTEDQVTKWMAFREDRQSRRKDSGRSRGNGRN